MEAQINSQEIIEKLIKLQADVDFIKNNMIDSDCILNEEDIKALKKADEEFEKGETFSLEDIEKERVKNRLD